MEVENQPKKPRKRFRRLFRDVFVNATGAIVAAIVISNYSQTAGPFAISLRSFIASASGAAPRVGRIALLSVMASIGVVALLSMFSRNKGGLGFKFFVVIVILIGFILLLG